MPKYASPGPLVFVGTYTQHGSRGIYVYRLNPASGELLPTGQSAEIKNPSFLALHPREPWLYSVAEISGQGAVAAFSYDRGSGALTRLNEQSSEGVGPCHITLDKTGRFALVANYVNGVVTMLPIGEDGRLGEAVAVHQHQGSSVNPDRQEGPHAHSVTMSPDSRFAFAADLGTDQLVCYRLDAEAGTLTPEDGLSVSIAVGSGPRHFAFHASGRWGYLINEMGSTVTAFSYDAAQGQLAEIQTITTLPESYAGESYCADIHVGPRGNFLYGSNRGHDSLAIYAIDETSGLLSLVGHAPCGGNWPRNFGVAPDGRFLLVGNERSDSIVTFEIDQASGELRQTEFATEVSMPVCVQFSTA